MHGRTTCFTLALGTLALCLACGGSTISIPATTTTTTGRTVTGTTVVTYYADSGSTPIPQDLSSTGFTAFVPTASGSFTTTSASGTGSGTFAIPGVAAGDCWIASGGIYVWGPATAALDFGFGQLGRPTYNNSMVTGTTLGFTLTGMTPWATGDHLQWVASNLGGVVLDSLDPPPLSGAPSAGATALNDTVFGWTSLPLADTTQGDQPFLLHLSAGTGGIVSSLTDVYPVASLTQADGGTPVLTGTFVASTPTLTCTPVWQGSAFAALSTQVNPTATLGQANLYYYATAEGTSQGLLGYPPSLLTCTFSSTDETLPDQNPKNPFPAAHWTPVAVAYTQFDVLLTPPGATTGATAIGEVYTMSTTLPSAAAPSAPVVGPPGTPLINGKDLFSFQSGVGQVPTLTWQAPNLGTATNYQVIVNSATVSGSGTTTLGGPLAYLYTTGTSAQIPLGLLATGGYYYFTIAAIDCPGVDLTISPYRTSFPYATASVVTQIVTP